MNLLIEQTIIDILNTEMALPADAAWVRVQNKTVPNDLGIYIVVGLNNSRPLASQVELQTVVVPGGYTVNEVQRVNMLDSIQIDIMGRDNNAIQRRAEIIMALRSIYSQQQQEANSFKISNIPVSFTNTSDAEGGSEINRFSIIITCFSWYKKVKPIASYYDDFHTRVDTEQSIGQPHGIIEFEITPSTPDPSLPA